MRAPNLTGSSLVLSGLALSSVFFACLQVPQPTADRGAAALDSGQGAQEASAVAQHEGRPLLQPIRQAVERSLPYLERDGVAWMEGTIPMQEGAACVSCHQVPFGLWGMEEARRAGVEFDWERAEELSRQARAFLLGSEAGRTMSWGPLLLGRSQGANDPEAEEHWRSFHASILGAQREDGLWEAKGQFPFQKRTRLESDAVATLWTLRALSSFAPGEEAEPNRRRALAWLEAAEEGETSEWLLARWLVAREAGAAEEADALRARLLARQRDDGGWSFAPGDESNAYSTGQVVYALSLAGDAALGEALGRGVAYLLDHQTEDGLWQVPSRLTSAEESHEKDYIYEYWGTAWATIGLSRVLQEDSLQIAYGPATSGTLAGNSVAGR